MSTAFPGSDNQQPQNPYAAPQQPAQQPIAPAQTEKKKGGCMKWGAAALGVLVIIGLAGSCGGDNENDTTPATSSSADAPAKESEPAPAPAEEKKEDVPREYKNALRQAENYVKTMPFSYQGLYDQLTSEHGGKFPPEAAQYAMDNLTVDWNAEALEAAKNYQDVMPMSDDQLYDQLTSEYGSQFTPEEAQYAIDHLAD